MFQIFVSNQEVQGKKHVLRSSIFLNAMIMNI
jgi:hypothetical protein